MSGARRRRALLTSPVSLLVPFALASSWWLACGADVDLGGTADGALSAESGASNELGPDAGNDDCEPCTRSQDCHPNSACVSIRGDADDLDGGDTYCASTCSSDSTCLADQTCRNETAADGVRARVCAPKAGTCPSATAPSGADGAPLDRCGALTGPNVASKCGGCRYDCQPNGCYGGWWCNTATVDCERPPAVCPD